MSDLIERDNAMDVLDDFQSDIENCVTDAYAIARQQMIAIPSERPNEGKWIEVEWYPIAVPSKWYENDEKPIYASKLQCSKCGFTRNFLDGHTAQYNFCPQCGADMTEREGER